MPRTPIWKTSMQLSAKDKSIHLSVDYAVVKSGIRKAAVVAYRFYDESNHPVKPLGRFESAKWCGPFEYIHATDENQGHYDLRLNCPSSVSTVEVEIYSWARSANISLTGNPIVELDQKVVESDFFDSSGAPTDVPVEDLRVQYSVTPGAKYSLRWNVKSPTSSQALLTFQYYNQNGELQLPGSDFEIHPKYGAYKYTVNSKGAPIETTTFTVPGGATRVDVVGVPWKTRGALVRARPVLVTHGDDEGRLSDDRVLEVLREIPEDARVVVVYTTAGSISPSNNLLLRSNRLAYEYAKAGWHVLFFPFSRLGADDPEHLVERLYQFERSRLRLVMDELLERRGKNNVLLCSTFTDVNMVGLIDQCHHQGWRVVYEVRDDMEEFNRVGFAKWYDSNLETRFASRSDAVVAVSPRLRDKVSTMTDRRDVGLVPNGAPDELIDSAQALRSISVIEERKKHATVGYIGHLTASWFDWEWLFKTATQLPTVNFEIIGHGIPDGLRLPRNVRYLGSMNHTDCLRYVKRWSAGLIPFKISRLTYGVDPNKAYEYVAMGLRTVSAPMGQVADMPGAIVYRSQIEMAQAVQSAVQNPLTEADLERFEVYLGTASWSHRSNEMIAVLEGRGQ